MDTKSRPENRQELTKQAKAKSGKLLTAKGAHQVRNPRKRESGEAKEEATNRGGRQQQTKIKNIGQAEIPWSGHCAVQDLLLNLKNQRRQSRQRRVADSGGLVAELLRAGPDEFRAALVNLCIEVFAPCAVQDNSGETLTEEPNPCAVCTNSIKKTCNTHLKENKTQLCT